MNSLRFIAVLVTLVFVTLLGKECSAAGDAVTASLPVQNDAMLSLMMERVKVDPNHADSWRLIGKLYFRHGDFDQAIESLQRSLALDPNSVASHFDLGRVYSAMGQQESASIHYQLVFQLADESSYASELISEGITKNPVLDPLSTIDLDTVGGIVEPVGYQVQTFDGSQLFERDTNELEPPIEFPNQRLRAFIELGALYNSNVSLTPISRELADVDAGSFQGTLSPELEYDVWNSNAIHTGPLGRGYFAINEQSQSEFDLASFQGGWFVERDSAIANLDLVGRVEYLYSLDLQGGSRFGDRHSLQASLTSISQDGYVVYGYGLFSTSQFTNDGDTPATTSLDGSAFMGGVTCFVPVDWHRLQSVRFGFDGSAANTEGADYRYSGGGINGGLILSFSEKNTLEPDGGVSFRGYGDFTGAGNRDQVILRLGLKLKHRFSDRLTTSGFIGYDRFLCDDEFFDSERLQAGVVTSWTY